MILEINGPGEALSELSAAINDAMKGFDDNPAVASIVAGGVMFMMAYGPSEAAGLLRTIAEQFDTVGRPAAANDDSGRQA